MSYYVHNNKKYVKWVRGEKGYAFSADAFRIDVDDAAINGERLMALEDTLVVSISHEDLNWVSNNIHRINAALSWYYTHYSDIYRRFVANASYGSEDKYDNIQRVTDFSLDRVPDVYLASYLGISLKELRKVKVLRGIGK